MAKFKVVVTDDRFDSYAAERAVLDPIGAELIVCDCKSKDEVIDAIKDADGVLLNLHTIKGDEISAMQKCKIISRYGIGYNNVDVDKATEKGIWVARVPSYGADEAVSDQAMALLMDCVRKTTVKYNRIIGGEWNLTKDYKIHQIKGSIIGVIGLGNIGSVFARKISGFNPKEIIAYDPHKSEEYMKERGVRKVSFEELLKLSDIISIHCPENETTYHMFDEHEFSLMKPTSILINTARGGIVKNEALVHALSEKLINSAGFDVFEQDPLPKDSPLRKLDNLIISDHVGYYTEESLNTLKHLAAENIANVLSGKKPLFPLNQID
ncbi:C-terminal binding protein [uncultured Sphaerochaeta sp.]|uniref:C-terminal binding protein n=1 Tax=uncultured Sphaerochaeta sp. TaxID=886478 RepID=UPI002A0A55E1|nr:C-terminal binding protein [uncultured Sphaerochaeta sp.]